MYLQDGSILVWKQHPETKIPEPAAMTREHNNAVCSLIIGANNRLYSGSKDCTIKVFFLDYSPLALVSLLSIICTILFIYDVEPPFPLKKKKLGFLFLMISLNKFTRYPGMGPSKYAMSANSNWAYECCEVFTLLGQLYAICFTGPYTKGLDVHLSPNGL